MPKQEVRRHVTSDERDDLLQITLGEITEQVRDILEPNQFNEVKELVEKIRDLTDNTKRPVITAALLQLTVELQLSFMDSAKELIELAKTAGPSLGTA